MEAGRVRRDIKRLRRRLRRLFGDPADTDIVVDKADSGPVRQPVLDGRTPEEGIDEVGARKRFVSGVNGRVGGRYCSPPVKGVCTDCSGLVSEEYFKATGKTITGDSHSLYSLCTPVTLSTLREGDLLFHNTGICRNGNCDSHVGVFVGNGQRVDAMNPAMGIRKGAHMTPYWKGNFTRAGRLKFT